MSEVTAPVVRTLTIRLVVPSDARRALHDTIEAFNAAVSFAVERAPSATPTNEATRGAVYEDLLARSDLPRRLALRACAEAADFLRRRAVREEARAAADTDGTGNGGRDPGAATDPTDTAPEPRFDHPSVAYDAESFTPRGDAARLQTVDGPVEVSYEPTARQREYLSDGTFTATDGVLHFVAETDAFHLQLTLRRRPSLA